MDKKEEREKNLFERAEEFLQIFKKGAEFTQELLKTNEQLRYRILQLEEENKSVKSAAGMPSEQYRELAQQIEALKKEKEEIANRAREIESENKDFAQRYVEVAEENNNLANLYIASYQLHSTLDFKEVLQIILEIIINLIGAEEFGIFLLDEKTHELKIMASEGIDESHVPTVTLDTGVIGKVAKGGEPYFTEGALDTAKSDWLNPIVAIPIKIKEHVIGVIVVYKLLQQKKSFTPLDHELFTLLAGHAATSIFSSKLYSESERKLSTIQGFIDLLTK
ncbi:MAG: GAF domain-containing protein [Deltaproteobacteria bacterium]|nr:GAF domain-containing protein [Deltaproteobacteria bacterium]MCL5276859.1 GAF domain-containing protein [Deltaproteobacteria bacterium]